MRMILATASLALLTACGGGTSNNAAGNGAASAGAAAAPANPRREHDMRECANDVRGELPAGTDLNAFCGCAVDKMQTGLRERDAMEQCAAEQGITPRR
ncbi:MAG TPA: hypothetical protein VGO55_18625 [Allosphingosinicella sp.]|jgi:hypothetical protein|nr:hypothetical protein [Allosphingosinicella sp.]